MDDGESHQSQDIFNKRTYIMLFRKSSRKQIEERKSVKEEKLEQDKFMENDFDFECRSAFQNAMKYMEVRQCVIRRLALDKDGNPTYVLDNSKGDDICLHIISSITIGHRTSLCGRPYIQCEIKGDVMELVDLPPHEYHGMGYGTMLVEEIIKIAKERKVKQIIGQLTIRDASTEEKKIRRNSFYEKMGFQVCSDSSGDGKIKLMLSDIT